MTTPPTRAHLPLDVARCQPIHRDCHQVEGCARWTDFAPEHALRYFVIDASVGFAKCNTGCELFIDQRGASLKESP